MKNTYKIKQTIKPTLQYSQNMREQIEMLSMSQYGLKKLFENITKTNPFLEYHSNQDFEIYVDTIENQKNLQEELYEQLRFETKPYSAKIASFIIESLDDNGFFTQDIQESIAYLHTKENEFLNTLALIQSFHPIGVAARSSIESIQIQLKYKGYQQALYLFSNFSYEIENNDMSTILNKMKINQETLQMLFSQIRTCTPFPCANYTSQPTEFITPEVEIEIVDNDIHIEPKSIGTLHILDVDLSQNLPDSTKKYLKEAYFYIDSLNKRNQTLLIMVNELTKIQKEYFITHGDLHSCTLKDIAKKTGYSISTVSRLLSNKYYSFQGNIHPFKNLFVSKTMHGTSKDSIQKNLIELIHTEPPSKPYSDDKLVSLLQQKELYVSRRTLAKYRNELHIPNASKRKKSTH